VRPLSQALSKAAEIGKCVLTFESRWRQRFFYWTRQVRNSKKLLFQCICFAEKINCRLLASSYIIVCLSSREQNYFGIHEFLSIKPKYFETLNVIYHLLPPSFNCKGVNFKARCLSCPLYCKRSCHCQWQLSSVQLSRI
jgi:hypothetical protein